MFIKVCSRDHNRNIPGVSNRVMLPLKAILSQLLVRRKHIKGKQEVKN